MPDEVEKSSCWNSKSDHSCELMSVYEILMGKGGDFPGLIPLCRTYLDFIGCDSITRAKVDQYLDFIRDRAAGRLMTNAAWIRQFVQKHPDYQQDSRVSQTIAYDLLMAAKDIGEGRRHEPLLTGDHRLPVVEPGMNPFKHTTSEEPTVEEDVTSMARTACCEMSRCRKQLLKTYVNRAISRMVEKANDELISKIKEMDKLQHEINELTDNLDLIRSSSAKITATSPRDSFRQTPPA